jgi:DNA-binding response OmpR family regulator
MLLVDNGTTILREHEKALDCMGISIFRVYTMPEAVARLVNKENFCCVVINEDTIPDFMRLLPELCGVSVINIYITTHSHTKEKQALAMEAGADAYVKFGNTAMVDAINLVQHLKLHEKWVKRPLKTVPVLIGSDVIMLTDWYKVFCQGTEISLAKKEYSLLNFFLSNPNQILTLSQIAAAVWGSGSDVADNAVYQQINKVKNKLCNAGFNGNSLENVTGFGYRLHTNLK